MDCWIVSTTTVIHRFCIKGVCYWSKYNTEQQQYHHTVTSFIDIVQSLLCYKAFVSRGYVIAQFIPYSYVHTIWIYDGNILASWLYFCRIWEYLLYVCQWSYVCTVENQFKKYFFFYDRPMVRIGTVVVVIVYCCVVLFQLIGASFSLPSPHFLAQCQHYYHAKMCGSRMCISLKYHTMDLFGIAAVTGDGGTPVLHNAAFVNTTVFVILDWYTHKVHSDLNQFQPAPFCFCINIFIVRLVYNCSTLYAQDQVCV